MTLLGIFAVRVCDISNAQPLVRRPKESLHFGFEVFLCLLAGHGAILFFFFPIFVLVLGPDDNVLFVTVAAATTASVSSFTRSTILGWRLARGRLQRWCAVPPRI
jgi:hypothetical protein